MPPLKRPSDLFRYVTCEELERIERGIFLALGYSPADATAAAKAAVAARERK